MQVCVAPLPQLQQLEGKPYSTVLQTSEVCLVLSIPHLPPIQTLQICPIWKQEFKSLSTLCLLTPLQLLSLCLICLC